MTRPWVAGHDCGVSGLSTLARRTLSGRRTTFDWKDVSDGV